VLALQSQRRLNKAAHNITLRRTRFAARDALVEFRDNGAGQAPRFACAACRHPYALYGDFRKHFQRDPILCRLATQQARADDVGHRLQHYRLSQDHSHPNGGSATSFNQGSFAGSHSGDHQSHHSHGDDGSSVGGGGSSVGGGSKSVASFFGSVLSSLGLMSAPLPEVDLTQVLSVLPADRCGVHAHDRGDLFLDIASAHAQEQDRRNVATHLYERWDDEEAHMVSSALEASVTSAVALTVPDSGEAFEWQELAAYLYRKREGQKLALAEYAASHGGMVSISEVLHIGKSDANLEEEEGEEEKEEKKSVKGENEEQSDEKSKEGEDADAAANDNKDKVENEKDSEDKNVNNDEDNEGDVVAMAPALPETVDVSQALLLADASEAFGIFDADGSGTIDREEFSELVQVLGINLPGGEHAVEEVQGGRGSECPKRARLLQMLLLKF